MKSLRGWDAYAAEAGPEDTSIELPLTTDEIYIIDYPTRRQGLAIKAAEEKGDVDGLVIALLGKKAGKRVIEMSYDYPSSVLDEFLVDVMRKFGFIEDTDDTEDDAEQESKVDTGKSLAAETNGAPKRRGPRSSSSAA